MGSTCFVSKADIIALGVKGDPLKFTVQLQLDAKKQSITWLKIMAHRRLRAESLESH